MTKNEELVTIMHTQTDLMEALVHSLTGMQQALVHSDAKALSDFTKEEQALLVPIQQLDQERVACVKALAGEVCHVETLLKFVPVEERPAVKTVSDRMRKTTERIVTLNRQNMLLIRSAHRFAQEMLRIITNDHQRKLVDERM